jgi:dihydroflavonol-4-reductase
MNLVTGATGMLGTHVLIELARRGMPVRALRREGTNANVAKSLFEFYGVGPLFSQVEWVIGDVLDTDTLLTAMEGCSTVYHTAAVVSYHKKERASMYEVNVQGTANVVNCAIETNIQALCHVSSIAALSRTSTKQEVSVATEWKDSPLNTHYGITKHLSEMEVWRGIQEGLSAVIVNPGFIIGPGSFERSSPSVFAKINEGMSYYPPGGTGFIAAVDCAKAMVELALKGAVDERHVLVSENMSMQDLFVGIASSLGKPEPKKLASPTILELARLAEWLKEKTTGKLALITPETMRNASMRYYYDTKSWAEKSGIQPTPIRESVKETARFFKAH